MFDPHLMKLLADRSPEPICGKCVVGLLGNAGWRVVLGLDEMRQQRRVEVALNSCANCGETGPTYRLAA